MRPKRLVPSSCLLLLCLAGCGYDPAMQGAHEAGRYKTDLESCQTTEAEKIRLRNAATLQSWVISPITGPSMVHAAVRQCLLAKGYAAAAS